MPRRDYRNTGKVCVCVCLVQSYDWLQIFKFVSLPQFHRPNFINPIPSFFRLLQLVSEFGHQLKPLIPSSGLPLLIIDNADLALGIPLMRTTLGSALGLTRPVQLALVASALTRALEMEARAQAVRMLGSGFADRHLPPDSSYMDSSIGQEQGDPSTLLPITLLETDPGLELSLSRSRIFDSSPSVDASAADNDDVLDASGSLPGNVFPLRPQSRESAAGQRHVGSLVVPAAELAGQLYGLIRHYGRNHHRSSAAGRGFFRVRAVWGTWDGHTDSITTRLSCSSTSHRASSSVPQQLAQVCTAMCTALSEFPPLNCTLAKVKNTGLFYFMDCVFLTLFLFRNVSSAMMSHMQDSNVGYFLPARRPHIPPQQRPSRRDRLVCHRGGSAWIGTPPNRFACAGSFSAFINGYILIFFIDLGSRLPDVD